MQGVWIYTFSLRNADAESESDMTKKYITHHDVCHKEGYLTLWQHSALIGRNAIVCVAMPT